MSNPICANPIVAWKFADNGVKSCKDESGLSPSGLRLVNFDVATADRAVVAGRRLHGRVHIERPNAAILDRSSLEPG